MNVLAKTKLQHIIHECMLHQKRIEYALTKLAAFMPFLTAVFLKINTFVVDKIKS